jgi:hypothetical protein
MFQDNSVNLLQYLVRQYVSRYDEHAGTEQAAMPLPEPSDITKAALVNFEDMEQEIGKTEASLKSK